MSGWPETALREVLADATPGFACGEDLDDGVFQFRMNNITSEGQLDFSKRRRVPRDYRNIDRFLVQPGDILFNATNSPDLVGKTAFFPSLEEPAVFSNHFLRLRPRNSDIDGRYLARWLNLQFQHGRFKGMCRQWVNQATVGRDALLSLKIPLPPLPEQQRIAEILDKADALRAKRRAALAQLDTLTQSIFLDMFGDPATNPKGWPVDALRNIADTTSGGTPKRDVDAYFGGPIPWVKSGELHQAVVSATEESLTERGLTESSAKLMPPGTLLVAMYGATVGAVAILGVEAATNQAICCINPSQAVTSEYLAHLLRRMAPSLLA
ncbi:MAG TPA: restriction endonuclease subunit S, partial [Variovorax sp.]